jgi:hypothetical protein
MSWERLLGNKSLRIDEIEPHRADFKVSGQVVVLRSLAVSLSKTKNTVHLGRDSELVLDHDPLERLNTVVKRHHADLILHLLSKDVDKGAVLAFDKIIGDHREEARRVRVIFVLLAVGAASALDHGPVRARVDDNSHLLVLFSYIEVSVIQMVHVVANINFIIVSKSMLSRAELLLLYLLLAAFLLVFELLHVRFKDFLINWVHIK